MFWVDLVYHESVELGRQSGRTVCQERQTPRPNVEILTLDENDKESGLVCER